MCDRFVRVILERILILKRLKKCIIFGENKKLSKTKQNLNNEIIIVIVKW